MKYNRSFKTNLDGYDSFACCNFNNLDCNPSGQPYRLISLNVSWLYLFISISKILRYELHKRSIFLMMVSKLININLKSVAMQVQLLLSMALSIIFMLNVLMHTELSEIRH